MKIKGLLLDLDGTIVDSRGAYLEAARTAFAANGHKLIADETVTEIPKRLEQGFPIDDLLEGIAAETFLQTYLKAFYRATATKTKPFPNVSNTLERLSKKAKLALATRRLMSKEEVIAELTDFGLAQYFQHVITAQDMEKPKPSPEALIKCSELLAVRICDCMVVGDSVVDVRAGKKAGAKTIAVSSGIFSHEELMLEKPDLILNSINELPEIVEENRTWEIGLQNIPRRKI